LRSTHPSSGFKTPIAALAVVDLPEPFGPISVTISAGLIENSTPRTSQRPLRRTPALFMRTRGFWSGVRSIKKIRMGVASRYATRYSITQLM
jgi:hypothetical protein